MGRLQTTPPLRQTFQHLVHQVYAALGLLEPLGCVRPQPHRGEGRLHHVRRPRMRPVGLGKPEERQAAIQVILQAIGGPIIPGLSKIMDHRRRQLPSRFLAVRLPDRPKTRGILRTLILRQLVQHVHRLVIRAPLFG